MDQSIKNKELVERLSATVKYNYGSPYVNDKPSLNPHLHVTHEDEQLLKAAKKAAFMSHLKKTNYKPGAFSPNVNRAN